MQCFLNRVFIVCFYPNSNHIRTHSRFAFHDLLFQLSRSLFPLATYLKIKQNIL